jgi:hypothetical protein
VRGKLAFDPRYGLSGSEDTEFLQRLWRGGASLVWCQEAGLTEYVPEERLTVRWLLERGFWTGQSYADIVERPEGGIQLSSWFAKRAVLAVGAALLAVSCVPFSRALAMRFATKVAASLGQISTILGNRHQSYRSSP